MSARILVVDDDPVQRRLLEAMIKRFEYEPVMAEGAEEMIEECLRLPFLVAFQSTGKASELVKRVLQFVRHARE